MITNDNVKYLDNEEKDFFQNLDVENIKSIPNLKEEITNYQKIAKSRVQSLHNITDLECCHIRENAHFTGTCGVRSQRRNG